MDIEFEITTGLGFDIRPNLSRIKTAPCGRNGGDGGMAGYLGTTVGRALSGVGSQSVKAGERIVTLTLGGGGYGVAAGE